VARQLPLREHHKLSHFFISEAVPASPSDAAAPTRATVAEAGICDRSWGQRMALQPESSNKPKPLPLGRAELITPHSTFRSTEPFILFYPSTFFFFFLITYIFVKDKRKAPCENITMETSRAHLYLPAKWVPNWSFASYWITAGHLLSFNFSEFLISLKSSFLERREEEARGESSILG